MRKKATKSQPARGKKGTSAIKDLEHKADPQSGFLTGASPVGGAAQADGLPIESISFNYSKMEYHYPKK